MVKYLDTINFLIMEMKEHLEEYWESGEIFYDKYYYEDFDRAISDPKIDISYMENDCGYLTLKAYRDLLKMKKEAEIILALETSMNQFGEAYEQLDD